MLTYIFAMVLNAVVVLTCDCTSHAKHATHHCSCKECVVSENATHLSQHCDCTHSHENRADTAVTVDTERVQKFMRAAVAELPRAIADVVAPILEDTQQTRFLPLSVSLDDDPPLSAGALRAPPVFA